MKLNEEELTDEQRLLVSCYRISHQCDESNSDIENVLDVEVASSRLSDSRIPCLPRLLSLRVPPPYARILLSATRSTSSCAPPASFSSTPRLTWTRWLAVLLRSLLSLRGCRDGGAARNRHSAPSRGRSPDQRRLREQVDVRRGVLLSAVSHSFHPAPSTTVVVLDSSHVATVGGAAVCFAVIALTIASL